MRDSVLTNALYGLQIVPPFSAASPATLASASAFGLCRDSRFFAMRSVSLRKGAMTPIARELPIAPITRERGTLIPMGKPIQLHQGGSLGVDADQPAGRDGADQDRGRAAVPVHDRAPPRRTCPQLRGPILSSKETIGNRGDRATIAIPPS